MDLYRIAKQKDKESKGIQQVRMIKDADGRLLDSEETAAKRWKEYFEVLLNEENDRELRLEEAEKVTGPVQEVDCEEVVAALRRMKRGKAVGPDETPVEAWISLVKPAIEFLTKIFNGLLQCKPIPDEWRKSELVLIFKNNCNVQDCKNYKEIKLSSHSLKLCESVMGRRLRREVEICEQQCGFMPKKISTDAIFALRILMEKFREGQRELRCAFIDLEKAYGRVMRDELWHCMRQSGVTEKYVEVVRDMYTECKTLSARH